MTDGHWAACTMVSVFSHTIKNCKYAEKSDSPTGEGDVNPMW